MDKKEFYTKGDREEILHRCGQVHTITIYCPLYYPCIVQLVDELDIYLPSYRDNNSARWNNIPTIDAFNIFLSVSKKCPTDKDILAVIYVTLSKFPNLKYINFEFTNDDDIINLYKNITENKRDLSTLKTNFFKVETLEFNLSNMFSQYIIDFINNVMILNNLLPNSYLERKFKIDFKFDEYIAFMNMFLGNNGPMLNQKDKNICDYLITFPELINKDKPNILFITNYSNL